MSLRAASHRALNAISKILTAKLLRAAKTEVTQLSFLGVVSEMYKYIVTEGDAVLLNKQKMTQLLLHVAKFSTFAYLVCSVWLCR